MQIDPGDKPNIYFWCYDRNDPSGGIKVLYRHVDILNRNGFSAFILHQTPGFRCTWFENSTPVAWATKARIRPMDYLVIPEEIVSEMNKITQGIKKVIFNQNCYYTFLVGHSLEKNDITNSYMDEDVVAAIVVSEDSKRYLSYVYPGLSITRVRNAIDPNIFRYNENKMPLISFMPRKHYDEIVQVINILKHRNALDGFEILPVHDKSEREVAEILGESLIFLSFGYPEGFSLPPAEAMACGCIVIGYHGMGGQEFFRPEFSYPIAIGDIISFAQTVEEVIDRYKHDKNSLMEKGRSASQYILNNYSPARQESDIVGFWKEIIKKA